MAYAVTLRLDVDAAARVRALWDALSAAGFANQAARLGYGPHLTLALLDDAADAARVGQIVREVSADWRAMRLPLSAVAAFPADPATLWLAPTVTAPLLDLHASLCAALPAAHPNYRPGAWIPHVTLAGDVTSDTVGAGIDLIAEQFHAFVAIPDGVDLVRFTPISLLWHARLAASNTRAAEPRQLPSAFNPVSAASFRMTTSRHDHVTRCTDTARLSRLRERHRCCRPTAGAARSAARSGAAMLGWSRPCAGPRSMRTGHSTIGSVTAASIHDANPWLPQQVVRIYSADK